VRTPFSVSLATACTLFVVALFALLFHHNTINGHVLTPMEQLPEALIGAVIFSVLALFGTWLGLRRPGGAQLTYRGGIAIASLYILATYLASMVGDSGPRTETIPSHEANVHALQFFAIGSLWGIAAPYVIALVVRRLDLFKTRSGTG